MRGESAFAVFQGKKKDTPTIKRGQSARGSLRKAASVPAISEEEKKGKGLLRVFKRGSFRKTIKGKSGQKLGTNAAGDSPYVAGDTSIVTLTRLTTNSMETRSPQKGAGTSGNRQKPPTKPNINGDSASPKGLSPRKNLPPKPGPVQETPKTGKKAKKQSSASSPLKSPGKQKSPKQQKPVPPVPPEKPSKPGTKRPLEGEKAPSSKRTKTDPPPAMPVVPYIVKKQPAPLMMNHIYDSTAEAAKVFECMIRPVLPEKFFNDLWQKKPLLVKRHVPNYNDGWFSTKELDRILKEESIMFGVNLDVTSYTDGKRQTHNPPGRAYAPVVWDYYQNGCSVRMLNPQTYSTNVWQLLSTLQEYFGCCVGANIYLTPPGTQGFAPHYDDIEAFILQLEGKKHWRMYSPRSKEETLPRTSSGNFREDEIGEPILDVTLEPGDLLYFPRGTIHQGKALEDTHSLHITVSCFQKNTWGDFLEKLLPRALDLAIEEDVEFREGLPRDYLSYMGVAHSDLEIPQRTEFLQKLSSLLEKLMQGYTPVDAVCDQMGKGFVWDSLPPVLEEDEKACSVHGNGEHWDEKSGQIRGQVEIDPDTCVKLIRKGSIRLVAEEESVRIYHNLDNARIYHGTDPQFVDITEDSAPAVEFLIHAYPEYVPVDAIPLPSVDERVAVASFLYDKGLLLTMEPLQAAEDETSSGSTSGNGDVD